MIDPRALRTFHAVCQAGTISGAARALNISQPSVSMAIAQLEASLGTRLFDRSRAGIMLTPEGEALRLRAEMLDNLLRDAAAEVASSRQGVRGPLRVGGTPGALVSLIPRGVRALERHGLHFALHVVERPDHALAAMLRDGDIELAFVTTEIEGHDEDIVETTFSRDPFALIVGHANAALPSRMSLRDAGDLRWVLPEAHGAFRRQVDALFIAAGIAAPVDVIRCDSLLTTKAIVRSGERVTILPMQVAVSELSTGVLRAVGIEEAQFVRSVGIRRVKDRPLSALARLLLDELAVEFPDP